MLTKEGPTWAGVRVAGGASRVSSGYCIWVKNNP